MSKNHEHSLNVAAFVKKFCESDQPPSANSPIATNVPLWLQDSTSSQARWAEEQHSAAQNNGYYPVYSQGSQVAYDTVEASYATRRQYDNFANTFGQNVGPLGESFDIRSVNWFDDLLGLAPSHSI